VPPPIELRDAVPEDLDDICSLIRALAQYERMLDEVVLVPEVLAGHLFGPSPSAHVTMAEDHGEVAGFALWFPTFSTFLGRPGIWLEDLFVRPEHRSRGIGLALIQSLRARTDGRVEWNVLDWNQPSIDFYESLGARPLPGWITYRLTPPGSSGR